MFLDMMPLLQKACLSHQTGTVCCLKQPLYYSCRFVALHPTCSNDLFFIRGVYISDDEPNNLKHAGCSVMKLLQTSGCNRV